MQRPYYRHVHFLEVVKQGRQMQIISVEVVQVNQVRLVQLELPDQPFGGKTAEEACAVGDAGKAQMNIGIQHAADAVAENILGRMIARMAQKRLVAVLTHQTAQLHCDASGAQRGNHVDLSDAHGLLLSLEK